MSEIKKIIMKNDGLTSQEADDAINEAREAMYTYLDEGDESSAHDICSEYFGLEPDYIMELM